MTTARHRAFSARSIIGSNRAAKFDGANPYTYITNAAPYEGDCAYTES